MTQILKQSTAVDVLIGPFLDKTNAADAETGESPSVKLSKNGQALAAKNDATTPVHDADGYYNCELDATDTNTVGNMVLTVASSANALAVRHEFQVVEEAIYDSLFAASAAGFDANQRVDVGSWLGNAVTASSGNPDVNVESIDDIDAPATWKASVNAEVDTALTDIHLDHLLAADYDPAAKPGTATALLNELVESDGGVSRFTSNALDEVWSDNTPPPGASITEARLSELDAGTSGKMANQVDVIETDTTALNDTKIPDTISLAAINAEMDTALTDIHLDHLLAADYDPASKPGTATALLNELVENDGGVSRFTSNALDEVWADNTPPNGADIGSILTDTATLGTIVPQKNAALSDIEFLMVDSTDHATPKTGLSPTGTRSIDGGAFGAVSGAIAEVGNGIYQFDALAADMNGTIVTFRFAATGADDTFITLKTAG